MMKIGQLQVPEHWHRIRTIDMHTGGEPLRVVVEGFPELTGSSVLENRRILMQQYDYLRKVLMHEPRGHADMYGCVLTLPNDTGADFGIIFLHNEGYSTMCGHATIAIAKLAVVMGWVQVEEPFTHLKIDAPCGRLDVSVRVENGQVLFSRFRCVPSFVVALDQAVEVPGLGRVHYDLAYGGAFYAYVQAEDLNLPLIPERYSEIIQKGMAIKRAVMANSDQVKHPFEPDLSFLYGTIFMGGPVSPGVDSRNVCVFAEGEVDRSPTGSGVSGRLPIHYARGEINLGDTLIIESILGSVFKGTLIEELDYGPFRALVPEVEGTAFITGQHEFLIDPEDPFRHGFFLR